MQIATLTLNGQARGQVVRTLKGSASGRLSLFSSHAWPHIPGVQIVPNVRGYLRLKGFAYGVTNQPTGAFRDFSFYQNGTLDPAMVLMKAHNGGVTTSDLGQVSGYQRYFAIASAPQDYYVSGGKKAWPRAAYASIGLKFKSLVSNGFEYIDGAQVEVAKYGASAPLAYQSARGLNCVLFPTVAQLSSPELAHQNYLIAQLLEENCPLGVTPALPPYPNQ